MNRTQTRLLVALIILALAAGLVMFVGGYSSRALGLSPEARAIARLSASEPAARLEAVKSLRGSDLSPAAVNALTPLLADPDPQVGYQAAMALGEAQTPAARQALIAALDNSNSLVRIRAAEALSAHPTAEAAPALSRLLLNNDDAALPAAKALVKIDNDVARNALWMSLADEKQTSRQRAAASALLENGQASVEMLKQAQLSGIPALRANATVLLDQIKVQ
ncbi:MAG: HEAT repeat domain-containing protein [Ardenticatenaceae bacterium]|nr:HEAT repeat domain-containing protein [Ardenticatenaceae bacterium]HBY96321.1 hypothetical protein [Chloroflexota bacterium]